MLLHLIYPPPRPFFFWGLLPCCGPLLIPSSVCFPHSSFISKGRARLIDEEVQKKKKSTQDPSDLLESIKITRSCVSNALSHADLTSLDCPFSMNLKQSGCKRLKHVLKSYRLFHTVAERPESIQLVNAALTSPWSHPKQMQDLIGPELTMPPLMKITH